MAFLVYAAAGLALCLSQLAARMTYYSRSTPLESCFSWFQLVDWAYRNLKRFDTNETTLNPMFVGGADGIRTHYLFNAIEALSQLSYSPAFSIQ